MVTPFWTGSRNTVYAWFSHSHQFIHQPAPVPVEKMNLQNLWLQNLTISKLCYYCYTLWLHSDTTWPHSYCYGSPHTGETSREGKHPWIEHLLASYEQMYFIRILPVITAHPCKAAQFCLYFFLLVTVEYCILVKSWDINTSGLTVFIWVFLKSPQKH